MRFFNLDLHISVIADVKMIIENIGNHQVDNWSISGHTHIMGNEVTNVDIINQHNWQEFELDTPDRFFERYEQELSNYDAFIVTHTPVFSMLYERFNKPIITIASTRFEAPFTNNKKSWQALNNYLSKQIDNKKIIPIANNKYDQKYTETFTERIWEHIPSLCEYTCAKYTGKTDKFLYSSKFKPQSELYKTVDKDKEFKFGYSWQELADYKGIIHIPYNVSTMSIFEQYTANIPLFFPTWEFLTFLCKNHNHQGVMSETSWSQIRGLPPYSIVFAGLDDPNQYDNIPKMMEWYRLSDFYDKEEMPHIQYFESFEHLNILLKSVDLEEITRKMKKHNKHRKEKVYNLWCQKLKAIEQITHYNESRQIRYGG